MSPFKSLKLMKVTMAVMAVPLHQKQIQQPFKCARQTLHR